MCGHAPEGSDREFLYIRKQVLTWTYLNIWENRQRNRNPHLPLVFVQRLWRKLSDRSILSVRESCYIVRSRQTNWVLLYFTVRREPVRRRLQKWSRIRRAQSFYRSMRLLPARRTWRKWSRRRRTTRECTAGRRSSLSMRFIASIRGSRIICFRSWRTARSFWSVQRQRIRILRSTELCCPDLSFLNWRVCRRMISGHWFSVR